MFQTMLKLVFFFPKLTRNNISKVLSASAEQYKKECELIAVVRDRGTLFTGSTFIEFMLTEA